MTYLQDQYNEMHPKPKTKEEQFHEWLSECPISITDIQDNSLDGYVGYAVDFEIVDSSMPVDEVAHVHRKRDLDTL